jgi:5-methylcytosine-specific restriction protein A
VPHLPLRPCATPMCPALVTRGHCERHAKERHRQIDRNRESPKQRGYDVAWRKVRNAKLDASPFCEMRTHCRAAVATEVHHIIPIAERPDLRLTWSNLQSACKACHSAETMSSLNRK